jgi:hypothetical protein
MLGGFREPIVNVNHDRDVLVWSPPDRLRVTDIEGWLEEAVTAPGTEIRLGALRRAEPRAESLLQSAILRLQRAGVAVKFSVPPLTFAAGRTARASAAEPDEPVEPMTPTEGLLAGSVTGVTIALLCEPLDEHAERAVSHVRDRLKAQKGEWGRGLQSSRIETQSIPGIRSSTWPSSRVASRDAIAEQLVEMTSSLLGVAKTNLMGDRISRWLVDFAFEAILNARTHGRVGLKGVDLTSLRTLSLRRHNLHDRSLVDVFGRPEAEFGDFARCVSRRKPKQMLECVVSDGGIGVPARMARNLEIYSAFPEAERQLVQEAMWPGWTTDTVRSLESGEGFRMMLRASARLHGYFEIRTGRQDLTRHYLREDGEPIAAEFSDRPPDDPVFALSGRSSQPYVAGTVLTLVFPVETD